MLFLRESWLNFLIDIPKLSKTNAIIHFICNITGIKTPSFSKSSIYISFQHEDFSYDFNKGYPNDIGLIRLSTPVDLEAHGLQIISAPQPSDNFTDAECYITGWGSTTSGIVLRCYYMVNFSKILAMDIPWLTHKDGIWVVCCEFKVWCMFYMGRSNALFNAMFSYTTSVNETDI